MKIPQVEGDYDTYQDKYPNEAFIEARGVQHHISYEEPAGDIKGLLFIMHGMDGHSGPSAYFARQVVRKNSMVAVGLDFRNFGLTKTNEKRGYIEDVHVLLADAEAVLTQLVEKYKVRQIFLAGLSMGGAIAFRMAINNKFPYADLIMFAPSIRQHPEASPVMKKIAKFIGWLVPTLELSNKGGSSFCLKHKKCRFEDDPLNYTGKIIPGSVRAVLNFIDECETMFAQLSTPYLMFMGGVEKVVDPFLAVDLDR